MTDAIVKDAEVRARLDKALEDVRAAQRAAMPSLAAVLGEYEPLEGKAGFWARAPKLRQQIEMARLSEQSTEDTATAGLEAASKLACLAVYFLEPGTDKPRPVTVDEILDNFNAEEVAGVLGKYMGLTAKNAGEGEPDQGE